MQKRKSTATQKQQKSSVLHLPKKRRSARLNAQADGKSQQRSAKLKTTAQVVDMLHGEADSLVNNCARRTAMVEYRTRALAPSATPSFKFVESVRRKGAREDLTGTNRHVCKEFYDAIAVGSAEGVSRNRCKHLENLRHRFRHEPLATPEGFWNIGFGIEL